MCGIFGYYCGNQHDLPESVLQRMASTIGHRGPDNTGIYREPGLGIGNNRLAIIDLSTGNQPISNEDHTLWIVYNGELYNHVKIRKELESRGHRFATLSDTETILHAFEEYGEDCLNKFNGMFAFAIWNRLTRKLFIARDGLGIKPLYYSLCDNIFVFGSEAKAVLSALPNSPEPDWSALYKYLSLGYVPSPESPFRGLKKLPPGHHAWVDETGVALEMWWEPNYGMGGPATFFEAKDKTRQLLQTSVDLEMISDVPVGLFLSGGLDSSAVAVFASHGGKRPLKSFSVRFQESTHDESGEARRVAEHLGLEHHEMHFTHDMLKHYLFKVSKTLDEPFGDSTVLPLLAVSEFARKEVKVVLTGWGGDEIFAGYPTYKAHLLAALFRRFLPGKTMRSLIRGIVNLLPVSDRYMSLEFKAKRFLKGMDQVPECQHFLWMGYVEDEEKQRLLTRKTLSLVREDTLASVRRAAKRLKEKDLVSRIMHLDAMFFLEGNGLFQADRMTMAASLEARVPMLNKNLVEYVNSLPSDVKMRSGRPKELLRRALSDVLPSETLRRPKKGFGPPSSAWTRGALSETLDKVFARDEVQARGIFVYDEIQRLLQEHRDRTADHGRTLWALLSFELWYRNFILKEPYPI